MAQVKELAHGVGISTAREALGLPRSSFYRAEQPPQSRPAPKTENSSPPRALTAVEKEQVRDVLNSERFQDQASREVYATLLDEQLYLCSWRTMYRILDEYDEVRERRNQLSHTAYVKPELVATAPNQLWSWDTLAPHCVWCPQRGRSSPRVVQRGAVQVLPNCLGRPSGCTTTCT